MFDSTHIPANTHLKPVSRRPGPHLGHIAHGNRMWLFAHFGRNFAQAAAVFLARSAAADAAAQCRYTWTEIPPWQLPDGHRLYPAVTGMNDVGQVVGYFQSVGGETETGFVWSEAEGMTLMPRPPGYAIVHPLDINDLGQVVGYAEDSHHFAFLWEGEPDYADLGFPPNGNHAEAEAINNFGQIVGTWGNISVGPLHAVLWESGVGTDLSSLLDGDWSKAYDINDSAWITGVRWDSFYEDARAFVLNGSECRLVDPSSSCSTSEGRAINGRGDICGDGTTGYPGLPGFFGRGFVSLSGQSHEIAPFAGQRDSLTRGLGPARSVIGWASRPGVIGFIWRDGTSFRLDSLIDAGPNSTIHAPMAIDEAGRIACQINFGAIFLTPVLVAGDTNCDCRVNIEDLVTILSQFGCAGRSCNGDLDRDGVVALSDLAIVLSNFGFD